MTRPETASVTLIDSPVSPCVRKVPACCELKGIGVSVDPDTSAI